MSPAEYVTYAAQVRGVQPGGGGEGTHHPDGTVTTIIEARNVDQAAARVLALGRFVTMSDVTQYPDHIAVAVTYEPREC